MYLYGTFLPLFTFLSSHPGILFFHYTVQKQPCLVSKTGLHIHKAVWPISGVSSAVHFSSIFCYTLKWFITLGCLTLELNTVIFLFSLVLPIYCWLCGGQTKNGIVNCLNLCCNFPPTSSTQISSHKNKSLTHLSFTLIHRAVLYTDSGGRVGEVSWSRTAQQHTYIHTHIHTYTHTREGVTSFCYKVTVTPESNPQPLCQR